MRLRAFEIGQSRADIELMFLWNLNFAYEAAVWQRSELAAYSILYPRFDGSDNQRERPLYTALATPPPSAPSNENAGPLRHPA